MSNKTLIINLIKSLVDYNSTTKWGSALRYAVAQIENKVEEDKFALWSARVVEYQRKKIIRRGQSWMCALADVDMPLYESWVGEEWDCFHDNTKCSAFMDELINAWSK